MLEHVHNYRDNAALRASFNRLTRNVFGFDFEDWYRRGFWDDRYVCHSFVENGEIISNVSATRFDLVIRGRFRRAVQLGTVMTREDHRGRGLAVELTRRVMDHYSDTTDLFYLFAQRDVWPYYEKQGFLTVRESTYETRLPDPWPASPDIRTLSLDNPDDLALIRRLTHDRVPVSETMGVVRDTSVFLFHFLLMTDDPLHYSEDTGCAGGLLD